MNKKQPIGITGLWLRRLGDHVHALVEVDGKWRHVITEHFDGPFSHIAEVGSIENAPADFTNEGHDEQR